MERETIIDMARAVVVEVEQEYMMQLWDEYYYLSQIPALSKHPCDYERMDEIMDIIEADEQRRMFPEDWQLNE